MNSIHFRLCISRIRIHGFVFFQCRFYSKKKDTDGIIPINILEPFQTGHLQENGPIIDDKPFKLTLKASEYSPKFNRLNA